LLRATKCFDTLQRNEPGKEVIERRGCEATSVGVIAEHDHANDPFKHGPRNRPCRAAGAAAASGGIAVHAVTSVGTIQSAR
jgi:hypothetical protein